MTKKKLTVSFAEASAKVVHLMEIIDNEKEDLDDYLIQDFADSLEDVAKAVDRRKAFLREVESKIELAKQAQKDATQARKKYENMKERIIETTKQVIEAHKNIPFKDSLGKNLKVLKNPSPTLVFNDLFHEGDWAEGCYAKIENKVVLDKEKLKEDLLKGEKVVFAKLEYGTQLRGMK